MAHLTMPMPVSIGHLVTPEPIIFRVRKTADGPPDNANSGFLLAIWSPQEPMIFMVRKTAEGPPDNANSAFYWPFSHAKTQ
jgi:hypothetical protein